MALGFIPFAFLLVLAAVLLICLLRCMCSALPKGKRRGGGDEGSKYDELIDEQEEAVYSHQQFSPEGGGYGDGWGVEGPSPQTLAFIGNTEGIDVDEMPQKYVNGGGGTTTSPQKQQQIEQQLAARPMRGARVPLELGPASEPLPTPAAAAAVKAANKVLAEAGAADEAKVVLTPVKEPKKPQQPPGWFGGLALPPSAMPQVFLDDDDEEDEERRREEEDVYDDTERVRTEIRTATTSSHAPAPPPPPPSLRGAAPSTASASSSIFAWGTTAPPPVNTNLKTPSNNKPGGGGGRGAVSKRSPPKVGSPPPPAISPPLDLGGLSTMEEFINEAHANAPAGSLSGRLINSARNLARGITQRSAIPKRGFVRGVSKRWDDVHLGKVPTEHFTGYSGFDPAPRTPPVPNLQGFVPDGPEQPAPGLEFSPERVGPLSFERRRRLVQDLIGETVQQL